MKLAFKTFLIPLFLVLLNLISYHFFGRVDLTEDRRFSLSEASENLVSNLENTIEVEVYLSGNELPGGFERLKQATKETLEQYKDYAGSKIQYNFIDPLGPNVSEDLVDSLIAKGMQPTNIFDNEGGHKTETLVFPYALVKYQGLEETVLLLKGNQAQSAQDKLNQSYENLEYAFSNTFKKLTQTEKKKIGLLTEFTKLEPINFAGLINALQANYDLFIVDSKTSESFLGLDALVLPKPDKPIDDSTKFKIDQYIMYGGKALFFIDGLLLDSIGLQGTYAQPFNHNLQDLFFQYGIRVNQDMIKDGASAAMVPLVVGQIGDKPNIQPIPYRFFPLINDFGQNLITKNIDMVVSKFASSIDTVKSNGISKTPLLTTTPYTNILQAPALVTYNDARSDTDVDTYNKGKKHIGYLLEGRFKSLYQNRILPSDARYEHFKALGEPTKLIVCSDGDLIANEIDRRTGNPLPLGFDKISGRTFGNLDFLLNAVDYLADENGVITARSKEVKLRPLDQIKTREERSKIQISNLVIPSVLVLLFGMVRYFFRKRKYTM